MSTFRIGDRVRVVKGNGYDLIAGLEVIVAGFEVNDGVPYVSISGHPDVWDIDRFEKVTDAPEPEDADDVEPEPLKEGDWVKVWAQVGSAHVDKDNEIIISVPARYPATTVYVRNDAIVRPDAGQVPPWVKPAQCTSLVARTADSLPVLMRCEGEAGHRTMHVVGWIAWTTTEAYGTVEVSS